MKALEKERISPYISQLYECGINDSDIKLVVDQFRTDLSGSSSLFLLRDDDKSDGIKLFSSGLTEAQQQFYVQHHRQDVWFNHYLDKGCQQGESVNILLNFTQFFETRIEYRFQIFTAHSCDFLLPSYARLA